MGAYTAAYTAAYPSSAGLVEEGYTLAPITTAVIGSREREPQVLDGVWRDAPSPGDFLYNRTILSYSAATFVKVDGTWSSVGSIPETYDRLVGGGYVAIVTMTELGELLSAGLITQDQYDAALLTQPDANDTFDHIITEDLKIMVTEDGIHMIIEGV